MATSYGSFEEALAAGQEAYKTEYDAVIQAAYDKLTPEQKELTKEWDETSHSWSGRTHKFKRRQNPEVVEYLRLRDQDPTLNLDTVMRDLKSMGYRREDVDFYREGSAYREGAIAQADIVKDYLEQEDIPLYKELEDGTRLYLTTGTTAHMNSGIDDAKDGKWIQAGDIGTYSTYWEPKPKLSFLEGMLANPVFRTALGLATSGMSEAYIQAGRAVTGEDLNSEEWASIVSGGANLAGLSGLQSSALQAAITGDPKAFGLELVGNQNIGDSIKNSLGNIGVPQSLLDDPDFVSGFNKTVSKLAEGESLEDAVKSGLANYVQEGGGFGIELPDAPDLDFGVLGEFASGLAEGIQEAGRQIGDVIDPALGVVGDVGRAIGDVTDPILSAAGDVIEGALTGTSVGAVAGGGTTGQSATRTTDGLFNNELFKFKTQIKTTPQPMLQAQEQTQPTAFEVTEEMVDLNTNPFASSFDRNIA